jgi:hypothetical protein
MRELFGKQYMIYYVKWNLYILYTFNISIFIIYILFILYETNYSRIIPKRRVLNIAEYFPNHEPITMYHSDKFMIWKTFGEVKNSTFRYNTGIIWE